MFHNHKAVNAYFFMFIIHKIQGPRKMIIPLF